jgi:Transposase
MEIVYERVAGIDVHKRQITVAVRIPGQRGARRQRVRRFATFYAALREMAAWLVGESVSHVAMESTGVYWMPVFHALAEPDSLEVVLCNAQHVKNVPGRKTDVKDAQWLAQLMEVGLLAGQFHPAAADRRDPPAVPVPTHAGRGTHQGRAAASQGTRGRWDQARFGGLRRAGRVVPVDDQSADRRPA